MADRLQHEIDADRDAYLAGLEGDYDDPDSDEPEPVPANVEEANVLLRRIRFHERTIDELTASHRAELDRLGAWFRDRTAGPRRRIAFAERALEGWMRGVHAANPKVKTHKLPNGEAAVRAARARVSVPAPDRVVTWSDSTGVESAVVWEPKVGAAWVQSWCIAGEPLGEPDADGYTPCAALFVPALVWPFVVPLVELSRRLAEIPGVVFHVPSQPTFNYKTSKAEQSATNREEPHGITEG